MLKKIGFVIGLCVLTGCVSTRVPSYLTGKTSFTRRFYAGHDQVVAAVKQAMTASGWAVEKETEPQVYEIDPQKMDIEEQTLLMSDVRERRLIVLTRYERLNVFIHSRGNASDLEWRYLRINDMTVFKPRSLGSQKLADQFFGKVEKYLEK